MRQRLIVGIVTAPRDQYYLGHTVKSLRAAATAIEVDILVAPTTPEDVERANTQEGLWPLEFMAPLWNEPLAAVAAKTPDHRGLERNSKRLLDELIARAPAYGGWIISAQDDIDLCRRGLDRAWQVAAYCDKHLPNVGAVSLYTPYAECGRSRKSLWRYPPAKYYGDLLVLWRVDCARVYNAEANMFAGRDIDICTWFDKQSHWQLWAHSPCLAQHTGMISATGKSWKVGQRNTMNFRGARDAVREAKPW